MIFCRLAFRDSVTVHPRRERHRQERGHRPGGPRRRPFVAVNCSAILVLLSQSFGRSKGSHLS
jgi:hypothetical protein